MCVKYDHINPDMNWVPIATNVRADTINTYLGASDDWMLRSRYFPMLDARRGPHNVDLFAGSRNAHCNVFISQQFWCPGTHDGVNSMRYI